MAENISSVGFIGLGVMGLSMAMNLIGKMPMDHLYVFDVSREAMERLPSKPDAIHLCGSSKEVAERADVIVSMVPEGKHVRSVYLTPETEVLAANIESKLIIECSTIDTATSLEVRDQINEQYPSASFYDAPVSGGGLGAEKATLTIMLGCFMGKSIFPCGGPALGLTAKLCNNYCSGLIALATAEAMNIGIRSGMDPRVLHSIFQTSTAQSTNGDNFNPVPGISPEAPSSHGYKGGFRVQMMVKDFGLAVGTAKKVSATLALGDAGLATYIATAEDPRCKDLDSRVVYRHLGGIEDWKKDKQ